MASQRTRTALLGYGLLAPSLFGVVFFLLLPMLVMVPILIARLLNEETVLLRDLPGYADYMQRTKYRLVPGIW